MRKNRLETEHYVAELKDGVLYVQFRPLLHIDLKSAEVIVKRRKEHFKDLPISVLIKNEKVKSIDREARDYLFNEGLVNINAVAFANVSEADQVLVTFLLGLKSHRVPCETFVNEEEAVAWLQQYV